MTSSHRRIAALVWCAIGGSAIGLAAPAHADDKTPPAPAAEAPTPPPAASPPKKASAADLARAKQIFVSGGRAFDAGLYVTALQLFEQAYGIVERDSIVLALGQTHRMLFGATGDVSHLDKSETYLTRYLGNAKAGPTMLEARKALEEVQAAKRNQAANGATRPATPAPTPATTRTGLYADGDIPGLVLSLDGGPPAPPPLDGDVPAGKHVVKASAPGYRAREIPVLVVPSQVEPVTIELEPLPGVLSLDGADGGEVYVDGRLLGRYPLSAGLEVAPGNHFVSVTRAGSSSFGKTLTVERGEKKTVDVGLSTTTQRDLSYVVISVGAAGLTAAGVMFGIALVNQADASDIEDRRTTRSITVDDLDQYEKARARRDDFAAVGTGLAIGGGAVLALGLGMFLFDREAPVPLPAEPTDRNAPPAPREVEMSVVPVVVPFGEERIGAVRATLTF